MGGVVREEAEARGAEASVAVPLERDPRERGLDLMKALDVARRGLRAGSEHAGPRARLGGSHPPTSHAGRWGAGRGRGPKGGRREGAGRRGTPPPGSSSLPGHPKGS